VTHFRSVLRASCIIPENKKKAMMERSKFRDHMAAMPLGLATPNWDTEIGLAHGTKEVKQDKQRSTKHTNKTKDRVTRTPPKTGGELMCSGRISRNNNIN
jgi:hypothetical protein